MPAKASPARWPGPWWGVLLAVVGIAIGVTAGSWQLGRAAEKRELEAKFAGGGDSAWSRLIGDADANESRYQVLKLRGRYDAAHQVLLDNMSYRGQPGYQVLTPFTTADGTVLVNRGWVPASGNRLALPEIAVDAARRELTGRVERLPRPGIQLAAPVIAPGDPWPRRLLFPTSAQISEQLGSPLRDYQLLLDPREPDGYSRAWQPGGMRAERHLGYAVQWFGLALTVLVIYIVLLLKNRKKKL